jgi:2-isopropylmalate synthase
VGAGQARALDAEHFFDGFALDPGYALDCLRAAADAGAERLVLCDTNGGSLPPQIRTARRVVTEALGPGRSAGDPHPRRLRLRRRQHAHRRRSGGATQVQGTINGIGERTGNANLVTIIADLQLKMGCRARARALERLTETAHFVDELLNRTPEPGAAVRGQARLRAQGGLHAAGVERRRRRPSSTSTRRRRQRAATC